MICKCKAISLFTYIILIITILSGCQSDNTSADLSYLGDIVAVSREEGSGTRDEFENIVALDENNSDIAANSTEETIQLTENNTNAIGYAAYSSVKDNKNIKITAVNGIMPDNDSIKKNKYPLVRSYYIAYSGELNDVENDFVNYIMSAGQNIVSNYCISVKNGSTFLSDKSSGKILINGSTSASHLMEALIDDYANYNPNAKITLAVTDSSRGLTSAIGGECDIAISSRELKDYEAELLSYKAIGRDAIAIIVNKENIVEKLTKEQIKNIYNKVYKKWGDIN